MKRFLCLAMFVASLFMPYKVVAQIVSPVHWEGIETVDGIQVTARIDNGWHMTLISIGDSTIGEEIEDSVFRIILAEPQPIRFNACNDMMCTAPEVWTYLPRLNREETQISPSQNTTLDWLDLLKLFLLGLLGGLLAIFTPCVWPIIPMTVSFFLKRNTDRGKIDAIMYGVSIIIIYVGLGLIITLLFGASALNALSTNAIVNLFFFALLVVFALSFFGLFEITLPSSWSTKLDDKARRNGGLLGIFLMAFTLVIVSFSCTGPIIGTLLVEAAGRNLMAPAIGMLGFSIALALPFSVFAMFPKWLTSMPRSGEWMQSLKVVLAFIELALSLKFLSVADMAYGWGILPRWLFLLLWITCFIALGIYLLWGIRRVSVVRKTLRATLAIVSIAFSIYLTTGLFGAPVKLVSAFAPPMPIEDREVYSDYEEGLRYAQQTHRPVLLDFSGYGCVNCRKMEAYILDNDSVKTRLKNYVLIELYVDDRQKTDDGTQTIGEKNSLLQQTRFGANAQPYYIQLDEKGETISAPYVFSTDVDDFLNWLIY